MHTRVNNTSSYVHKCHVLYELDTTRYDTYSISMHMHTSSSRRPPLDRIARLASLPPCSPLTSLLDRVRVAMDSPASYPPDLPKPEDREIYVTVIESVTRVAMAGFGGALAGLSVSRRRGSFREAAYAVDRTVRTARKRPGSAVRSAPYVDNELPSTWAMACLSFAGILEFMRLVQPTKMLVDGVVATGAYDVLRGAKEEGCAASTAPPTHPPEPPFLIEAEDAWTVSDYILGGSLAGAVFKGSSVQTSAGERLARRAVAASAAAARSSAQNRRAAVSGVGSGLVAGATLGLLAGMLHVAISNLEQALEDSMELDSAGVDQSKSDDEDEASKEQICAEDSTS